MKILVKKEICKSRKQCTNPLEVLNVYSINYSYHKSWNKNKNENENKVDLNTFFFFNYKYMWIWNYGYATEVILKIFLYGNKN